MPNKWKMEEAKHKRKARSGLSPEQVAALDASEALEEEIQKEARRLQIEMFPEEFDFMFDSNWDANDRSKGINPMSPDYIERINEKRKEMGVSLLSESGRSTSNDTYKMCLEMVREKHKNIRGSHL
jgi:hypothetical protein